MAIVSTVPTFLDNLRTALLARAGLAGVKVFTAWVDDTEGGTESIQFYFVENATDWGLLGNRRITETYTVTGEILIAKAGAGEAVIKSARDRAYAIFNEMLQQLRTDPAVTTAVRVSRVQDHGLKQGVDGSGMRLARIEFTLTAEVDLTP